jgi:integrase/recombinase XerD
MRYFAWTGEKRLSLNAIKSYHVSGYLAELATEHATPTVKQHLAALRMLFDWLIVGQVIDANPAATVRAAKHVVKKGKTPVLKADQARELLDSIPLKIGPKPKEGEPDNRPPSLIGLRNRALIGVMVFSFARVTAALGMKVEDYYTEGRRAWFRLHEKGGKRHEVPAHHNAEDYLDAYIAAAGTAAERKSPLFRSIDRHRQLTDRPMHRNDAWRMIKRRAKAAGLPDTIGNHTFRATGITAFRKNGGTIEQAQQIANHASPQTTRLYDRSSDEITLDAVERIVI